MQEGYWRKSFRLYSESWARRSFWRETWFFALWMTFITCGLDLLRGHDRPFSQVLVAVAISYVCSLAVFGAARFLGLRMLRVQVVNTHQ